jgi:hypothetical protein
LDRIDINGPVTALAAQGQDQQQGQRQEASFDQKH